MADQVLRIEFERGAHLFIMDHGANALDRSLVDALRDAIAYRAERGSEPLLFTSSHPTVFSPGWDLKKLAHAPRAELHSFLKGFNRLIFELFSYPGPTAAAIRGHAVAGGCLLALACDVRVMASGRTRLGLAELNLGVPVPAACVRMLNARLAPPVVEELMFLGDGFTAERCRELGLVHRVASPGAVDRVAHQLLTGLAAKPRSAFSRSKAFLLQPAWTAMKQSAPDEDQAFLDSWFEESTQERIQATAHELGH